MLRQSVPDVDFVNADCSHVRCVNCCKSLLKMPLLNVLYSMPSQMKVVRQCPNADLFPELKNRSFECGREAGFRMRQKRNHLNRTFMAMVTVDSMNRVNQVNFANPSHRQTANIPFVEVFQCNLPSAALRTSRLLPDETNYRLFLKVLYVFFLKFTDSLIVECQTKRTPPPLSS